MQRMHADVMAWYGAYLLARTPFASAHSQNEPEPRSDVRRARVVGRRGAAGQHHADHLGLAQGLDAHHAAVQLGKHLLLADAPRRRDLLVQLPRARQDEP